MRRLAPALASLLAVLVLVGCGDDAAETTSTTTTTAATGDWCELLDDQPTEDLLDAVPAEHRKAAEIAVAFSTAVGGQLEEDEDGAPANDDEVTDLAEQVVGEVERLDAFAAEVQASCPRLGDDAVAALRALTTVAAMASEARDEAYCTVLATSFESELDGGREVITALASDAPPSHQVALERIAALADGTPGEASDEAESPAEAIAGFMGLGLYAESVCGVDDAFDQMMLAGAFLSMGEGFGETNAGTVGTEPPAADPSAATAALPAGSPAVLEVLTVDLDDDGDHRASVVVPSGWDADDMLGVTFEPPASSPFGFFSSMSVRAGCDGMCEVTDWEERLRGESGYLTTWAQDRTVTEDRAPSGGDGAVITTTGEDGEARALVVRWDDTVDHYFSCEATLDAEDATLLPALVAACEAARPNWFPVG